MLDAWQASAARFREDANAEEDLVLGGYRDRVVIELAQNAADAASRAGVAGRLRFELKDLVLRVANTGAALDSAGVESASTLRASAKRDEAANGAVGRFGVGFAAVLAVSDEPAIISRSGGVGWSRTRTIDEIAKIADLQEELARRGDAVPVLRLPFPVEGSDRPPQGYDTEVVLPLRDEAAVELVRQQLLGVDAALLLTLPALASVEIVLDGATRQLVAEPMPGGVVVDGVPWFVHSTQGRLASELLRDRPVEEQSRREFALTWAIPVDDHGSSVVLPPSVPGVAHAPTPTDEPVSLPALLIAPLPLDPTRRHVAPGALRDYLLEQAAIAYVDLMRELPATEALLRLVPTGAAQGALDGELRSRLVPKLREASLLASCDGDIRLRPSQAVVLEINGMAADDELVSVLCEVLPALVSASWARAGQSALSVLSVRRVALVDVIDELGAIDKPATWWRALYSALDAARISPETLAGLPVPLTSGGLARSPRGLSMPGAVGDLTVLGLRGIDPEAAHPLLLRLGAVEPEPRAILADERVRATVENAFDADDPERLADAVLGLVAASAVTAFDEPWLTELALPGDDGELYAAGELLLPGGALAGLVIEDSPFGIVAAELIERWGAATLTAVGVLDGFALLRMPDVAEAAHDLDGEAEYLDVVTSLLDSDEPVVIDELVAVRDLEFVRDDAWPAALKLLAEPPFRDAVVGSTTAFTSTTRLRVVSYTAWWLRKQGVASGRVPSSDPLLVGLYEVCALPLDDEFLAAVGVLRELGDADPDDVVARVGDPERELARDQVRAIYARVEPNQPPHDVRAVRQGELVVVPADDAVVVDQPDLLPLLGKFAVVPAALSSAERVADALDLALASEVGSFAVVSSGRVHGDHVVHEPLLVENVDGEPTNVAWRLVEGELHVDADLLAYGLGRGRSWRDGDWSRRHLETELVRDAANAALLLAEADLDEGPKPLNG